MCLAGGAHLVPEVQGEGLVDPEELWSASVGLQ